MQSIISRVSALTSLLSMLLSSAALAQPAQPTSPQFESPGSADVYSDTVGATPGDFRVDEGGSGNYSIPIATLPGTAGLTPKLSLDYSARSPSGLLGPGFRLGGSSAIQRCRTSVEAGDGPGPHAGIDFQNDRYDGGAASCIDGERMFRTPGENNVEDQRCRNEISAQSQNIEVGHAFRVELDPATRICGYVRKGSPNYDFWLVYPKDGSLRRYGYAPGASLRAYDDSLQSVSIGYLIQSLDRIADPSGNTVDFSYTVDAPVGEQLLTEVRYTGRVGNRQNMEAAYIRPPYARTVLVYETLPAGAGRVDFLGGSRLELRKRLARIELHGPRNHGPNPDQEVQAKRYILGYAQATSGSRASRLVEVRECSGDGGICYPPTRFTWNDFVSAEAFPQGLLAPGVLPTPGGHPDLRFAVDLKVGDINGDGRQDLVFLKDRNCTGVADDFAQAQSIERFRLVVLLSDGEGFGNAINTSVFLSRKPRNISDELGLKEWYEYTPCGSSPASVRLLKFERDSNNPVQIQLQWSLIWHLYDVTGDGRDDLIAMRHKLANHQGNFGLFLHRTAQLQPSRWGFQSEGQEQGADYPIDPDTNFSDFTGDGLPDLMIGSVPEAQLVALERTPAGTPESPAFRFEQISQGNAQVLRVRQVSLSGFEENANVSFGLPFSRNQANVGDIDGDGIQDLALAVSRWRGSGFFCGVGGVCLPCGGSGQEPCLGPSPNACRVDPNNNCGNPRELPLWDRGRARWQSVAIAASTEAEVQEPGSGQLAFVKYFVTARTVVNQNGSITLVAEQCVGAGPANACANDGALLGASFADLNGDGLADLWLTRRHSSSTVDDPVDEYFYRLNRGGGATSRFLPMLSADLPRHRSLAGTLQLVDLTGDRRLDLLYVCELFNSTPGRMCQGTPPGQPEGAFAWRLKTFGSSGFQDAVPAVAGELTALGAQNPSDYVGVPMDFNGDGALDVVRLRVDSSNSPPGRVYPLRARMKYGGNDFVVGIESGLGAEHRLYYSPMVNQFVYERLYDGPLKRNWGRGSVVFDVFTPLWVVREARSSAPGCAVEAPACSPDSAAHSIVRYSYQGARVQSGGRGFLGFQSIRTEDVQNSLLTTTEYRQDFPFIGRPSHTILQKLVSNIEDPCLANPLGPQCFADPPDDCGGGICPLPARTPAVRGANPAPQRFMSLTDPVVSDSSSLYQSVPAFNPSERKSIAVSQESSIELRYDPADGSLVQKIESAMQIDNFGNVVASNTVTFDGQLSPLESFRVAHFYGCVEAPINVVKNVGCDPDVPVDIERVRLGRLSLSGSIATRGNQTVYRRGSYEYDPVTLLLHAEVSGIYLPAGANEPPVSERPYLHQRTDYELDANGNRTLAVSCSVADFADRAACLNRAAFLQRQWPDMPSKFQRYQKFEYDTLGRFLQSTKRPYYSSSFPAGVERVDGLVGATEAGALNRNAFGDPLSSIDALGVETRHVYGPLGRLWFTASETGTFSRTIYRWCVDAAPSQIPASASANCPLGAVFRVEVNSSVGNLNGTHIAPRAFSYHDKLGREILKTMRAYQSDGEATEADKRWSSSYTRYDVLGRVRVQSEPYFSKDPLADQATHRAGDLLSGATAPKETVTRYDVYGRSDRVDLPSDVVDLPSDVGNAAASTTAAFTAAFTYLTTTTTDPRGKSQSIEKNALSEQVRATDQGGFFVNYTHVTHGNLHKISRTPVDGDSANQLIETVITHDVLGRAKSVQDPDRGLTRFVYNALGEMLESTDAKGQKTRFEYDALGRMVARHEQRLDEFGQLVPEQTSRWEYDTATLGGSGVATGLLKEEKNSVSMLTGLGGYLKEISYDAFGRPIKVRTQIEGVNYWQRQTYDEYGRPFQIFSAATSETAVAGLLMQYSADGFPIREREAANGTTGQIYREALSTDARGQVRKERYHDTNNLLVVREYDANTGRLRSITSGPNGLLQKWNFKYDLNGNLEWRHNQAGAAGNAVDLKETFIYDDLNRLKSVDASIANAAPFRTMTLSYDQLGNIVSKSGAVNPGAMRYRQSISGCGMAGPHALSRAGNRDYCYDANGNATEIREGGSAALKMRYTGYDRVAEIESFTTTFRERFSYAPDRSLMVRVIRVGGQLDERVVYVGDSEFWSGSVGKVVRRVGGYLSITETAGNSTLRYDYLLKDHLGSVEVIASETGALRSRRSFDAHGMRRALQPVGTAWAPLSTVATLDLADEPVTEGFGGHRQLDRFGLVHMGARLYDPYTGRFLQADVYTEPEATQGLNRYSFVVNNPLTHTDPTGNLSLRQALGIVVGVVAAISGQWYFAQGLFAKSFAVAVAGGFASAAISTGSLRAGLWGAVSAAAFWGIGSYFTTKVEVTSGFSPGPGTVVKRVPYGSPIAKVAAHAMTGGTLAHLQGGKFGHGFASAGFTQALSPVVGQMGGSSFGGVLARTAASAVIGGTASKMTGGSFSSGAQTGAFSHLFNHELHLQRYADNFHKMPRETQEMLGDAAVAVGVTVGTEVLVGKGLGLLPKLFSWTRGFFGARVLETSGRRVRHHTSPEISDRIDESEVIFTSRGGDFIDTTGVHVEMQPFGPAANAWREVGAAKGGAYVEFDEPANIVRTYIGNRNTGVIPATSPLPLSGANPTFVKQPWWQRW